MTQTTEHALSQVVFYSDGETYILVKLPPGAITAAAGVIAEIGEPFCAMVVDKNEVTLLIPKTALEGFGPRLPGHIASAQTYRLITLDVALEPALVSFMARISTALAEAGIPIFPYAAYTRDHILVPSDRFDAALRALEKLKQAR